MPIEMRTIIFDRDELTEALSMHGRDDSEAIPPGKIIFCRVDQDPDFTVTVKFVRNGSSEIESVSVQPESVGSALVQYCMNRSIPIPRNVARSLQSLGENVAMHLSINQARIDLPGYVHT